jgi:tetratricopeptide (TPR) repeat protein
VATGRRTCFRIVEYQNAIKADAKYDSAYGGWGDALGSLGRHDDAIAKYRMAIAIDPKNVQAYAPGGAIACSVTLASLSTRQTEQRSHLRRAGWRAIRTAIA